VEKSKEVVVSCFLWWDGAESQDERSMIGYARRVPFRLGVALGCLLGGREVEEDRLIWCHGCCR